jgi:hypothetical protein
MAGGPWWKGKNQPWCRHPSNWPSRMSKYLPPQSIMALPWPIFDNNVNISATSKYANAQLQQ